MEVAALSRRKSVLASLQQHASSKQYGLGANEQSKVGVLHPFPNTVRTREGLRLEDAPFLPQSEAEQNWLDRHGYPNAEQFSEYQSASDAQLEQASDAGDTVAETYLNVRKLQRGDENAEAALLRASALGDSFALELLSSTLARADPVDGFALSRVVEMRGNFAIAHARDLFFPAQLTAAERVDAENRARAYFKLLSEYQQEIQGKGASPFDPRPAGGG